MNSFFFCGKEHMNSKHRNRKNVRLDMSRIRKNARNSGLDVMYEKYRNYRHQKKKKKKKKKKRTNKYEVKSCD